jgi:hypothetical protein
MHIQTIFISHSHLDQNEAYALSEWIYGEFTEVRTYISDRCLSWREELLAHNYLYMIPHIDLVLGLLSKHSMTSNAVFDELEVALKAAKPIILIFHPQMDDEDRKVYSYLQEMWEPKYGKPLDFIDKDIESALLTRVCQALRRRRQPMSPSGALARSMKKQRSLLEKVNVPMPDWRWLSEGQATRAEAIQWLAMLERELHHRMLSKGYDVPSQNAEHDIAIEVRVGNFLLACGHEWWPEVTLQLRPLLDQALRSWLTYQGRHSSIGSHHQREATALLNFLRWGIR